MKPRLLLCSLFFIMIAGANGQQRAALTIATDNDFMDIFLRSTDRYYTGGLFVKVQWQPKKVSKVFDLLMPNPFSEGNSTLNLGLNQKIYTPFDISCETPKPGDYPYAAAMYFSLGKSIIRNRERFQTEILIGTTGPAALGEEAQKTVHHLINYTEPKGWKYQGPNALLVNYNLQYEKAYSFNRQINGYYSIKSEAGTLINAFTVSNTFLLSNNSANFLPGLGDIDKQKRSAAKYIAITPSVKYVLSNGVIQNVVFNEEYSKIISSQNYGNPNPVLARWVGSVCLKMGVVFKRFGISYHQTWQTREIKTTRWHKWGTLKVDILL